MASLGTLGLAACGDRLHPRKVHGYALRSLRGEVPYEKRLARLFSRLLYDGLASKAAGLDLWCGGDHVRREWFTLN